MSSSSSGTTPVNDSLADTPSATPPRPIADVIAAYRPYKYARADWERVADFVRACAVEAGPSDSRRAQELMRTLIPFVLWSEEEGHELDRDAIFTPDNIERYIDVATPELGELSKATRRSLLRKTGRRVTTHAPWEPRPTPLHTAPRKRPYTAKEIDDFRSLQQPTDLAQHRLQALLALGLGAGVTGVEYYSSTARDVWTDDRGLTRLRVHGRRAREVVVFDDWAEDLHAVAGRVGNGHLLGGALPKAEASRLWHIMGTIRFPNWTGRLQLERLRSTWLVRHLDQGTPLRSLLPAAGLTTTAACTDLLPYVRVPDPVEAADWLAGRRCNH